MVAVQWSPKSFPGRKAGETLEHYEMRMRRARRRRSRRATKRASQDG